MAKESIEVEKMNKLAHQGKFTAIRIFASILLMSVYVIVTYNLVVDGVSTGKIIQQVIRFCLTVLLMYFVLKGRKWAVLVATVLFFIGAVGALFALFNEAVSLWAKTPFVVMLIIYTAAIIHLNFSNSFKAYLTYLSEEE